VTTASADLLDLVLAFAGDAGRAGPSQTGAEAEPDPLHAARTAASGRRTAVVSGRRIRLVTESSLLRV
jgi:hypothetical protein